MAEDLVGRLVDSGDLEMAIDNTYSRLFDVHSFLTSLQAIHRSDKFGIEFRICPIP